MNTTDKRTLEILAKQYGARAEFRDDRILLFRAGESRSWVGYDGSWGLWDANAQDALAAKVVAERLLPAA